MNKIQQESYESGRSFTHGAFAAIKENVEAGGGGIQEGIRAATQQIFEGATQSVKDNFKLAGAGKTLSEQWEEFLKSLNLEKAFGLSAREASKGLNSAASEIGEGLNKATDTLNDGLFQATDNFNEGMKEATGRVNFRDPGANLGKEFGEGIKSAGKPAANAIGEVTGDLFRNITLNSVPYLISGTLLLVGTPLLALYCYHKAKHNIGRPKLASEVRYVGILDRIQEKVVNVAKGTWDIVAPGLKWGTASGLFSLGALLPSFVTCALDYEHGSKRLSSICGTNDRMFLDRYQVFSVGLVGGSATLASTWTLAMKVKKWVKEWVNPTVEAKPIFHKALQEQINEITDSTYNLQKNGGFFQNVLLYGPGGTGKTMVAKMIAKNSHMNYVMMSGGDLAQYIKRGEHVTEINNLFENIKKASSPTILFIDEMESLCGDRKKMDKSELFELLNAFLSHTGEASDKLMIIGATNMPDLIDPAVLSRMDHKLYIGPPDHEQRYAILEQYIDRFFTRAEKEKFFPSALLTTINKQVDGLTGRAIFKMVNALSSKKMATKNKELTKEMIASVVHHFISQEVEMKKKQSQDLYKQPHKVDPPGAKAGG